MGRPIVVAEIAFATDPTEVPSWTDVTDRLRGFSTSRGRQDELDRYDPGRATVLLDNRDRALDPTNEASALYPDVLPVRRIRVRLVWDAVSYAVFTGFAEGFPQSWTPGGADAVAAVPATDGFEALSLARITASYAEERTDERVSNVADDAGWPAADRDFEIGQSDVQAVDLDKTSALRHLQIVEATENGRLFVTKDGDLRFIDRHSSLAQFTTSQATFGDGGLPDELPFSDLVLAFDSSRIWNEVIVSREGGSDQTAEDTDSQGRYFRRTLHWDSTLITTDGEALSAAQWLLSRYKEPSVRVDELTVDPLRDDALWPAVLGLELGDRVTVKARPPGGGDPLERELLIEGISWGYDLNDFEWRARFSPASQEAFWLLEVPGFSELEETTRLGY